MAAAPDASVAPAACNSSSPLLSAASSLQVEKYLIGCANQYYFATSCTTLDYSTVVRHEYIYPRHPVRRSSHHYLWGRVLNSLALDKTRQRHRNLPIPPFRVPCIPPSLLRLQQVTLRWNSSCRFWAKSSGVRCRLHVRTVAVFFLDY